MTIYKNRQQKKRSVPKQWRKISLTRIQVIQIDVSELALSNSETELEPVKSYSKNVYGHLALKLSLVDLLGCKFFLNI
jgi:hypothetical protein